MDNETLEEYEEYCDEQEKRNLPFLPFEEWKTTRRKEE